MENIVAVAVTAATAEAVAEVVPFDDAISLVGLWPPDTGLLVGVNEVSFEALYTDAFIVVSIGTLVNAMLTVTDPVMWQLYSE